MSLYRSSIPDELYEKAVRLYGAESVTHPSEGLLCIRKNIDENVLRDLGITYDHSYATTVKGEGLSRLIVQENFNRVINNVCYNVAYYLPSMHTWGILITPREDKIHFCLLTHENGE